MWAVDPGDVHVGFAEFGVFGTDAAGDGWVCTRAWEKDPDNAIDDIAAAMLQYHIDVLVVEEFRLYPDKAMAQTGSIMGTCELIGQIKWAHRLDSRRRREEVAKSVGKEAAFRKGTKGYKNVLAWVERNATIDLILQPAAIQAPTTGVLRRRGIKSVAKATGAGGHALSAELHGWHYILRGKDA